MIRAGEGGGSPLTGFFWGNTGVVGLGEENIESRRARVAQDCEFNLITRPQAKCFFAAEGSHIEKYCQLHTFPKASGNRIGEWKRGS